VYEPCGFWLLRAFAKYSRPLCRVFYREKRAERAIFLIHRSHTPGTLTAHFLPQDVHDKNAAQLFPGAGGRGDAIGCTPPAWYMGYRVPSVWVDLRIPTALLGNRNGGIYC